MLWVKVYETTRTLESAQFVIPLTICLEEVMMNLLPHQSHRSPFDIFRLYLVAVLFVIGVNMVLPRAGLAAETMSWTFSGTGDNVHEITVPDHGFLDFRVRYDSAILLNQIKFQFSVQSCNLPGGGVWVPQLLYKTSHPPNGKYYNVNIPVGPGKVEIVVDGELYGNISSYRLYINYSKPLAWGEDLEPNYPFDTSANLGWGLNPPVTIPSLTGFYTCPGNNDQSDYKDYFQFSVDKTGYYKFAHRRLEDGDEDCETIVSLKEESEQSYTFYKWYLREKDESHTFLLSDNKTYFLDLQLVFGRNSSFPMHCSASVELGLLPAKSPWLGIEDIKHAENTVCGLEEEYSAVIRNDGDKEVKAITDLNLFPSQTPDHSGYFKSIEITIPAGGEKTVHFTPTLADNYSTITGEWVFEISAWYIGEVDYKEINISRKTTIGVLCRPPIHSILLMLLNERLSN